MVNKSSLAKKLASYSVLATAILAVKQKADAQIVYTKVIPNDTISYWTPDYKLDLNNDGIIDFDFHGKGIEETVKETSNYQTIGTYKTYKELYIGCAVYNSNKVLTSNGLVKPLNAADLISAKSKNWKAGFNDIVKSSSSVQTSSTYQTVIKWPAQEHYVGLMLVKGGDIYYGWARVYVDYSKDVAIIYEYGYNATPDSAVYAGQECALEFPAPITKSNDDSIATNAVSQIQWYCNNTVIPSDTTQNILMSQYGIYYVTTGDTNGCHGTSLPFNYLDCNAFHPTITTSNNPICYNYVYGMQLDTIPPYYSVQWLKNNSIISGETHPTLLFSTEGNYEAIVYEFGGCSDTSNTLQITTDKPIGIIKQSHDTLFAVNKGSEYPFTSYQWYNSSNTIPGATLNYYVPSESGIYSVDMTDSAGCTITIYDSTYTGINPITSPADIFITASGNLLKINFNSVPYNGYQLAIYNYLGQKVYSSEIISDNMTVNLNILTKGLYLVTLEKGNSRIVKKIVLD